MSFHDDPSDDEYEDPRPDEHALLPPEDRLWRHPSELSGVGVLDIGKRGRSTSPLGQTKWRFIAVGVVATLAMVSMLDTISRDGTNQDQDQVSRPPSRETVGDDVVPSTQMMSLVLELRVQRNDEWASASATVYRRDGYVLTVGRLVEGADQLVVVLGNGQRRSATVAGVDTHTDIAVLVVHDTDLGVSTNWSDPSLGTSISLVGRLRGASSILRGSVRAVAVRERLPTGEAIDGMILTDVPLTAETSGGAVVGGDGAVVGLVNTMPFDEAPHSAGAGAVSAAVVEVVAEQIIDEGRVRHARLGVEVIALTSAEAMQFGRGGVQVAAIEPAGPAATAGVRAGDVITAIGGDDVSSVATLMGSLRKHRPGDSVALRVQRDGIEDINVRLGSGPEEG